MSRSFTLPSFAKINLHLSVKGKREDGYHEICTVFQTVSLHDELTFSTGDTIALECDNKSLPTDERNLIVQAAELLRQRFHITKGAEIHLKKRIPTGGGLGGGSSNAAVALIGLCRLWDVEIKHAELTALGKEIGADVPFFFCGGTAIGTGRGTEITLLNDLRDQFLLTVTPEVSISTSETYARLSAPNLTKTDSKRNLQVCRSEAESLDLRQKKLINDLEPVVFSAEPEIKRAKETLLESGAVNALMSGSGASVFSIFDKQETRQAAIKALDKEVNWRKFAVATVSREEYRGKLGLM